MKNSVRFAAVALMATLISVATQGHAFTLGDLRGSAVLGRTLDVSVQVLPGSGEEVSAACMAAELLYADARQDTPRLSVAAPTAPGQATLVRLQSTSMVNEPVVSITLRATCGSTVTRRYVLLADFPPVAAPASATIGTLTVPAASPVLVLSPQLSPLPSDSTPSTAKPSRAARAAALGTASAKLAIKTKPTKATGTVPAVPVGVAARKAADRLAGKAILKLDPMDILSDRIDSLDSVMSFASTEDALRQTREISGLQGDVMTLREQAAKNAAKLADLQARLQQAQAQAQQTPVWLLYVLSALVLLCLAALAFLWRQQRRAAGAMTSASARESWWHGADNGPATILMPPSTGPQELSPVPDVQQPEKEVLTAPAVPTAAAMHEVDIDLDNFMMMELSPEPSPALDVPVDVAMGGIHRICSSTILDVCQQAEFFVSLGQTERALRVLKKQIADSAEPNPLVYLDLLALYHSLGLRPDFHACRTAFNRRFNSVLPDFPAFTREGMDLLAYPEMLAKLAPVWPSAQALTYLDACIFHDSTVPVSPSFDLAAFRDLLTLHALAEELATDLPAADQASAMTRPTETAFQPGAQPTDLLVRAMADKPADLPDPLVSLSRLIDLDYSELDGTVIKPTGSPPSEPSKPA